MEERWVSVEEISKHLGVARDTVYRWIEQRGLPAHKIGRLWKFKLVEVDLWVQSASTHVQSTPVPPTGNDDKKI